MGTVLVLLNDGVSTAWRGMTPAGLFDFAIVEVIPQRTGSWRLSAKAFDATGRKCDETQLGRILIVDP